MSPVKMTKITWPIKKPLPRKPKRSAKEKEEILKRVKKIRKKLEAKRKQ